MASLPNPCLNSACGAHGTSVRRSAGVVPGRSARGERPCARRCAGTGRVRPRLLLPPSARYSAPAPASHLSSFPRVSGPASFLTSASARALARILQAPTPPRAREPRKGPTAAPTTATETRNAGGARQTHETCLSHDAGRAGTRADGRRAQLARRRGPPAPNETPAPSERGTPAPGTGVTVTAVLGEYSGRSGQVPSESERTREASPLAGRARATARRRSAARSYRCDETADDTRFRYRSGRGLPRSGPCAVFSAMPPRRLSARRRPGCGSAEPAPRPGIAAVVTLDGRPGRRRD